MSSAPSPSPLEICVKASVATPSKLGDYRYQKVVKPRAETPIDENEIRITSQGRMRNYITYAMSLIQSYQQDCNSCGIDQGDIAFGNRFTAMLVYSVWSLDWLELFIVKFEDEREKTGSRRRKKWICTLVLGHSLFKLNENLAMKNSRISLYCTSLLVFELKSCFDLGRFKSK
ncbi:hypothetical protein K1719_016695 [Acacia pycnantha]|nr:hypothetical protein K1719_016695 [Acacia pycnantha]